MPIVASLQPVTAASMAATITSDPIDTNVYDRASIQAVWTGTPTGAIKLQQSNDGANWSEFTGTEQPVAGTADNFTWLFDTASAFVRVVYTRTSGTGVLDVRVRLKD
jgi:hypothetical protein